MSSHPRSHTAYRHADGRGTRAVPDNVYPLPIHPPRGPGHPGRGGRVPAPVPGPIRLTRRGRMVVLVCTAVAVLAGVWITTRTVGLLF